MSSTKKRGTIQRSPNRQKKLLVMFVILCCITFNMFLTYLSNLPVIPTNVMSIPPKPGHRRESRRNDLLTMPPRESSEHTVGMVHVGKTAGSTISHMLRNGCTSFVQGSCRNVTNESEVSRRVVRTTKVQCIYILMDLW
jgi:hypothetical protein